MTPEKTLNRLESFSDMANILCAGIAVLDEVFRVRAFPMPDTRVQASEFITVGGGNAANAAVAIARLGGKAYFAAPLGVDAVGDHIREFLGSSPFIPLLETNPLGVKVAIRETYLPALAELETALQSAG